MKQYWNQLFDMAYLRKNIVEELHLPSCSSYTDEDTMDIQIIISRQK